MTRAAQKSMRGSNEPAKQDSTHEEKSQTTASDRSAKSVQETNPSDLVPTKSPIDLPGFQSNQFETLRAVLDKRSEENVAPSAVVEEFASLWLPSLAVDIELLVPALREAGVDDEKSSAARVQKDLLNILLANLIRQDDSEDMAKAKLEALSDGFDAYEKAAKVEREGLGESADDLGQKMKDRFDRLKRRFVNLEDALGEAMDLLAPRSLSVFPSRQRSRTEPDMPRYSSNTPDRDDQGRFVSDNDRGSSRGGGRGRDESDRDESGRFASEGRSSRSRYDDDDNRSRGHEESGRFVSEGRSSRSRDDDDDNRSRGRDESGRFVSEGRSSRSRDDDGDNGSRGRSVSRGRQDDHESDRRYSSPGRDDDDRQGGRSHGGWSGDSERHSEASRRGWERSDHGESGWFGDREGHSDASRRGWQRADHGESGWYGDSEGHSEAARRGWEDGHRSQRRDDDDGRRESRSRREDDQYSTRSRDDDDRRYESRRGRRSNDDDDRGSSSRGRGHGGWSGDPEGHSEASRRGWENRR
jgi:hypothetical protein